MLVGLLVLRDSYLLTFPVPGHSVGMVGVPVNALVDWPMATRAGHAVFLDPRQYTYIYRIANTDASHAEVTAILTKVLNAWGEYLV